MTPGDRLRQKALDLGFDAVGIAPVGRARHAGAFKAWLEAGHAGEMSWLAKGPERRCDPTQVLPGARSLVMVGWSYYVEDPPPEIWNDPTRGRIARYAWGTDYHQVLEPKLKTLSEFIVQDSNSPDVRTRYYVDTGPLLEREWAARAGLGFIGKNTLLIHRGKGSYLFLGAVLVTAEYEYDEPAQDGGATVPAGADGSRAGTCGSCRRCQDICPTHAFPAAYILDSRRCISYLTIELKGSIPVDLRPKLKNWIYGCDECQSICPWVKQYASPRAESFLRYDPDWVAPRLQELIRLQDSDFRDRFRGTPIRRTKRRGLLRNVATALGNSGDPSVRPDLEAALGDEEPLVREHAAWALEQLG